MKQSIEWHEGCLKNRMDLMIKEQEQIDRMQKSIDESMKRYLFLYKQIEKAKKQGKKEFDSDSFLVKRKAKA